MVILVLIHAGGGLNLPFFLSLLILHFISLSGGFIYIFLSLFSLGSDQYPDLLWVGGR